MIIAGPLKSQIDKLWEEFWTGGITNPLTVIEQISFLMFLRMLDITESRNRLKVSRNKQGQLPFDTISIYSEDKERLRWSNFKQLGGEEMLKLVRDEAFAHLRLMFAKDANSNGAQDRPKENGKEYLKLMADAQLMIQKPSLLVSAVNMIDRMPLDRDDTKGNLYEYLLSKLTTAGINGQFRTPRHIIDLMVQLVEPKPTDVIGDPACGTAGFLVGVIQYLVEKYTSSEGIIENEEGGKLYSHDLLEPYWQHVQNNMFYGFDFDVTMLRIAAMNLILHGIESPHINYQDTLSNNFPERYPRLAKNGFDIVLANPPFKGSLDEEDIHASLVGKVKTKKTELLFITLILGMLKVGGRSATIVPDGVLFGSSKAHLALRQLLVDENQLEAIISLPSGVFKPYAGVSTAIIVFTKGGQTKEVFFYDVEADGYSLDDKRDPIAENDLPDVVRKWKERDPKKDIDRKDKAFFVPVEMIKENNYDLSLNRYKETVHEEVEYESPKSILQRLRFLESEIELNLGELEGMLK